MVGSCDRITPLMLTDWMLEKSENIPVPGALVVCRVVKQIYDHSQHAQNPPPDFYHTIQTRKLLPQAFPSLMGKLNLTTAGATDVSSVP